jgi:predicted Zn-dependent protease
MHFSRRFPQRIMAATLALLVALAPLRADELPELGDVASSELSLATEKKIGQQIMHEIRWRYLDDPDVENYLNVLGNRLAAVSNDPGLGYSFFPINDLSINAFAMPGGFIGVHTGLILAAQSESELAGVLAHEISHVTQRHIARQVFQSRHLGLASMVAMGLALLAARSNSQIASAAIVTTEAGAMSAQLAFSRDYEREADRVGFETLRKAGFDVRGMGAFFERLQRSSRLYENNATAYLRTHPLSGERMADMQNRDQGVAYKQVADGQDYQLIRAKLRAQQGTAQDAIRDFDTLLKERKFSSEGAIRYGLAVAQMRARNWSAAERELLATRQLKISSPIVERQLAEVKLAKGEVDAGLGLYREVMLRYPLNLAVIYGYGQALLAAGRPVESLKFADTQLRSYAQDIRLHKMRAESYAALGKRAQQHLALSEVFILQGQTRAAIEQLEIAQRAGDGDFYTMSAIDSRQRELKRRFIEEEKERRK